MELNSASYSVVFISLIYCSLLRIYIKVDNEKNTLIETINCMFRFQRTHSQETYFTQVVYALWARNLLPLKNEKLKCQFESRLRGRFRIPPQIRKDLRIWNINSMSGSMLKSVSYHFKNPNVFRIWLSAFRNAFRI